jgi:hypothetical protein
MGAVKHREDYDPNTIVPEEDALSAKIDFTDGWIVIFLNDGTRFREITKTAFCVFS